LALGAQALCFDDGAFNNEPGGACYISQLAMHGFTLRFCNAVARSANHKHRSMSFAGVHTGNKGVQPFDFMDEAMFYQKIERAIGDWWLRTKAFVSQEIQNLIGSQSAMLLEKDLQNTPAYWGELQTIGFAEVLDSLEPAGNAAVMIVRGKADAVHGASFEGGQLGIDMLQHAVYQAAKTL